MNPAGAAPGSGLAGFGRQVGRLLRRGAGGVLDALLPPTCLGCGAPVAEQGLLCAACLRELNPIGAPLCACCGVPFRHAGQGVAVAGRLLCPRCAAAPPPFAQARAAWRYDEGARRLILPFKYADRPELGALLARRMAVAGRELLARADLLLPVPLHRARLRARRYNQAAVLAAQLARLARRPWAPDLLRRCRATAPLLEHSATARAAALEGAFALAPGAARRLAGRHLLLIDDVLTSGATAGACARLLLEEGGAAEVSVLAAARVDDPRLVV